MVNHIKERAQIEQNKSYLLQQPLTPYIPTDPIAKQTEDNFANVLPKHFQLSKLLTLKHKI